MIQVQTLDFSEETRKELQILTDAIANTTDREVLTVLIERHDELVKQAPLKPCS